MTAMEIRLENFGSWWLWLLLMAALLLILLFFLDIRRARSCLRTLFDDTMSARLTVSLHPVRRFLRQVILLLAVFLALLALARPRGGRETIPKDASNLNIVIALDVSRSMLAADSAPSRLEVAKWLAEELVTARSGDRFALIPFAGKAFIEVPLTLDRDILCDVIGSLSPDTIPLQGTSIQSALRESRRALAAGEGASGAVVLISDGEELQGDGRAEAALLEESGTPVFTVALGNPEHACFIQLPDGSFLRDNTGAVVTTRVNEQLMRDLTSITGGQFWLSTEKSYELVSRLAEAIGSLSSASAGRDSPEQPMEYFQFPLALAVLLLLAGFLFGDRRRQDKFPKRIAGGTNGTVFRVALIFRLLTTPGAVAEIILSSRTGGEDSFRRFEDASLEYAVRWQKVLSSFHLKQAGWFYYGTGRIHQIMGDWDLAHEAYQSALLNFGEDEQLRGMSLWNLGMIAHLEGREAMTRSPISAAGLLEQARQKYIGAMADLGANASLAGNQEILLRDHRLLQRILTSSHYDNNGQWLFMTEMITREVDSPPATEEFDFPATENLTSMPEEFDVMASVFTAEESQGKEELPLQENFTDAESKPVEWGGEEKLDSALLNELFHKVRQREKNFREVIKQQYFDGLGESEQGW